MTDTAPNWEFRRETMELHHWEGFLLGGWDRVGEVFFHRRHDLYRPEPGSETVFSHGELMPIRYPLAGFRFTDSQRRVLRKNRDLKVSFGPKRLTEEKVDLFDRWHMARFGYHSAIFNWVSVENKPFPTQEVNIFLGERLIACSFFDATRHCQYSTTACFEPEFGGRSLGVLTLLAEVLHGIQTGRAFHFPGHAYVGPSKYDYKKKFNNMEAYDWETGEWQPLARI